MNRTLRRARAGGLRWDAVALGWVVAVVAGIVLSIVLGGLLGLSADNSIDQRAVFEDQHRGNAGNLILRRCLRIIVDV